MCISKYYGKLISILGGQRVRLHKSKILAYLLCLLFLSTVGSVAVADFAVTPTPDPTILVTYGTVTGASAIVYSLDVSVRTTDYALWLTKAEQLLTAHQGVTLLQKDNEVSENDTAALHRREITAEIPIAEYDAFLDVLRTMGASFRIDNDYSRVIADYADVVQALEAENARTHPDVNVIDDLTAKLNGYDDEISKCSVAFTIAEMEPAAAPSDAGILGCSSVSIANCSTATLGNTGIALIAAAVVLVLVFTILLIALGVKKRRHRHRRQKHHSSTTWPNETRAWVGEDRDGNVKTADVKASESHPQDKVAEPDYYLSDFPED